MLSSRSHRSLRALLAAPVLALSLSLAGCGGDGDPPRATHAVQAQSAASSGVRSGLVGAAAGLVTATSSDTATAGLARLDSSTPVAAGTMFAIGSNTKAMTAVVAARLVERGVIRWDSRVVDVLPELQATMLPVYANDTFEQLLDHKGGLRAYTENADLMTFAAHVQDATGPLPTDETGRRLYFVQFALSQTPPDGAVPGTTFSYSNAGYALAAAMLERAAGQDYETLFAAELAQPLGIAGVWGAPDRAVATQAHGYWGTPGHVTPDVPFDADTQAWFDVINPAGGFATTPATYAKWLQWHLQALQGATTPLPAGYVQRLKTLATGDYGLGWIAADVGGRVVLAHNGALNGFIAEAAVDQSGRAASFVMTNTSDLDTATTDSWVIAELNDLVLALEADGQPGH
jgi:CubicO group peptidase (beta-lactamase class C family)